MRAPVWFLIGVAPLLAAWGDRQLEWPHAGPSPDDPGYGTPSHYSPITAGTKRFRPVEPLSWEELNRRVAPQKKEKNGKDGESPKAAPGHKH